MEGRIRITPEEVGRAGHDLDVATTAAGQALGRLSQAVSTSSPAVMGHPETAAALDLFASRMRLHLGVQAARLDHLGRHLARSAQGYGAADLDTARALAGAADGEPQ